ncbi:MAG: hypothetical protein JNN15_01565 [Blastocatellia bacterium]|nr:hypothetical protein [Blastocatellia bacterium]
MRNLTQNIATVLTIFFLSILVQAQSIGKLPAQENSPPPQESTTEQKSTEYKDPDGKYELQLPPNWKAVSYQDGVGKQRIDIIYRDRSLGLLKISQENFESTDIDSFIRNEIEQNLRFRPGYVYNNTERFVGSGGRGALLEYDFSLAGKPKKGRHYYIKGKDGASSWILRFSGNREVLGPLRHDTDSIARSFKPL